MKSEYGGGRVSRLVETMVDVLKWILIYRPGGFRARKPQPARVRSSKLADSRRTP